jgi:hypothetical protein
MLSYLSKNKVFKSGQLQSNVICPPDQVFSRDTFNFLLTSGGHLAGGEDEYNKLMRALKSLGEKEFYVVENLGATQTVPREPYNACFSVDSNLEYFNQVVDNFDPPFGFFINHFYVFGDNPNWGIYICEYPTMNIIGCENQLSEMFAQVFDIESNGYEVQKEFIGWEYQNHPDLQKLLEDNYNLLSK